MKDISCAIIYFFLHSFKEKIKDPQLNLILFLFFYFFLAREDYGEKDSIFHLHLVPASGVKINQGNFEIGIISLRNEIGVVFPPLTAMVEKIRN